MVPVPSYPVTGDQDNWSDVADTPVAPLAGSSFPKAGAANTDGKASEGFSLSEDESKFSGDRWKPVVESQMAKTSSMVMIRDRDIFDPINYSKR